jgi:hypothetical protein
VAQAFCVVLLASCTSAFTFQTYRPPSRTILHNAAMSSPSHNNTFFPNESLATRSYNEALVLHRRACKNLEHVFKKARAMEAPPIESIYSNTAIASCAPGNLQLDMLFKHFNEIANARLVAHPSLPLHLNAIIMLYGYDIGHCLQWPINMVRYNLVLMVFVGAGIALGNEDLKKQFGPSFPLWHDYVCAWLETLCGGGDFDSRIEFINTWDESQYDIAWFSRGSLDKMSTAFKKIEAKLPPFQGDPAEFLIRIVEGQISEAQFNSKGPAMALHYLLAKERASNERKREEEEAEKEGHDLAIAASEDVPFSSEADSDSDPDNEMEVEEEFPVPAGVRLTHVDWDSELLQALLNINTSIPINIKAGDRPKSDRIGWIDQKVAVKFLRDEADEMAKAIRSLGELSL